MRSERLKRLAFVGLAISGELLVACSDKGPTKAEVYQAFEQSRESGLILDPTAQPEKATPDTSIENGLRPNEQTILPTTTPNIPHFDSAVLPEDGIFIPIPSDRDIFGHPMYETDLETSHSDTEEEKIIYESVNWDSLNLIDPVNVARWEEYILKFANEHQVPPEITAAVIDTESHGRTDPPFDELPGDGVGLMGIMPLELGFPNRPTREELLTNHAKNISVGTAILSEIYNNPEQGNESWLLTFVWYNGGLRNNLKYAVDYALEISARLNWGYTKEDIEKFLVIETGLYQNEDIFN
jgi:hypothetical protein